MVVRSWRCCFTCQILTDCRCVGEWRDKRPHAAQVGSLTFLNKQRVLCSTEIHMPNLFDGHITDINTIFIEFPSGRYDHALSNQSTRTSSFYHSGCTPAFAMIGISAWDYIFIRTCIFVLHLVAPLSVLYSLVSWLLHLPFRIPRVLEVWLALEAVFYLLVYLPRRTYLQAVVAHPAGGRDERRRLFWRCHINIPDPERYLKRWFRDAPTAEIKRENVKDFFRWAFLHSGEPDPAYDEELEEYVGEMEKLLGRKLEPGRGNAQSLRLTLDKVEMLHRSLTWYLVRFHGGLCNELLAHSPIHRGLLTCFYSVCLLSIRWHPSICATTLSPSTARRYFDFSQSSPRACSLCSLPIVRLRELSHTGTGRTPPGPGSLSCSYTVSVLDSTRTYPS